MQKDSPQDQFGATRKLQKYNKVSKLYDKIRVLGRGSFGTASVYRRRKDRTMVVLKEIDLLRFKGDEERLSAVNEVEIMSSLDHPNIIKYYNAFATDTKLIIEMEYANFGTLATYLSSQKPLDISEILIILKQLSRGLSYLHNKNIIHLDLKMENIFLKNDGLVKIGDFGIAKHLKQSEQKHNHRLNADPPVTQLDLNNNTGDDNNNPVITMISTSNCSQLASPFQCTLAYSSPERCLGEPSDYKSDIWSLGCILYELITSKPLFSATSIAQLVLHITQILYSPIERQIPENMKSLFELMISRDPHDRPPAEEIQELTSQIAADYSGQQSASSNQQTIINQNLNSNHCKLKDKRRMSSAGQLEGASASRRLQLLSILGHNQSKIQDKNINFDEENQPTGDCISSEFLLNQLGGPNQSGDDQLNQLQYPHSLLYQISLNGPNITLGRVGLPQSKRIRDIAGGKSHFLALTYDNLIFGWGSREHGQLGSCQVTSSTHHKSSLTSFANIDSNNLEQNQNIKTQTSLNSKPIVVISELNHTKIIQVAAGNNFSVFLCKTGIVMTCGDATFGCLGHGDSVSYTKPRMVESLLNKDVVHIAATSRHVVAICGNGHVYAWGLSKDGRLGVGQSSSDNKSRIIDQPRQVVFPPQVKIIGAFCGPKSTIFLDTNRQCWACGDNSYNKLGLDVVRRFKRTKIIESAHIPTQVEPLNKLFIRTCSISRDHSLFISQDARLYILGRDLDHAFRLDSYRQTEARNLEQHFLTTLNTPQIQDDFTTKKTIGLGQPKEKSFSFFSNRHTKWKTRDREMHIKTCRSLRKTSFEVVQSVATSSQFSLALTADNRIYFWGTRSHQSLSDSEYERKNTNRISTKTLEQSPLIDAQRDDCFIKIAHTNKSVMQTMQLYGSDQPIMHAQDPRLIIKNMSDLWVLDYQSAKPLNSKHNSDVDSIVSSSSQSSAKESHEVHSDCVSCYSDCSQCSCVDGEASSCSCCTAPHQDLKEQRQIQNDLESHTKLRVKHDLILEPQPIVSLYVPPTSLFNHQVNSLRVAKIHCFNKENFYLVMETTYKSAGTTNHLSNNHMKSTTKTNNQTKSKLSNLNQQAVKNSAINISSKRINCDYLDHESKMRFRPRRPSLPVELDRSPNEPSRFMSHGSESLKAGVKHVIPVVGSADEAIKLANVVEANNVAGLGMSLPNQADHHGNHKNGEIITIKASDCGNGLSNSSSDCRTGVLSGHEDEITISSGNHTELGENKPAASSLGMSLDEPRSLSTFAQCDSSQIVIGPNNRLSGGGSGHGGDMRMIDPNDGNIFERGTKQRHFLGAFSRLRRRATQGRNKLSNKKHDMSQNSGSSANTTVSGITEDTTTSMPSWVCNEYLEHKQMLKQQQLQKPMQNLQLAPDQLTNETIFKIDSNSDTRTSEISNDSTDLTQIGIENGPDMLLFIPGGCYPDSAHQIDFDDGKQRMLLTCDIPEVLRPRAKSFGESNVHRDQQSSNLQRPLQTLRNRSKTKIFNGNSNMNHNHINNSIQNNESSQNVRRHWRPMSLNASQQFPSELLATNWLPSGSRIQSDDSSMKPNLDQFMKDSQSSGRALTEVNLCEQQQQYNKASSQNGGSNLSLASLRNSIIKLFK